MDNEKKFYVYIYTSPSGKHYVGRTHQTQRQRAGIEGCGYKNCTAFWNAIQKYGWDNFEYEVLEENISADEIDERENYWIDFYHSSADENGYNLLKPDGTFKQATEELRKKLSEERMGEKNPLYGKRRPFPINGLQKATEINRKPVMQFDMDGNYIATFNSRREAGNAAHCQEAIIGKCCIGKSKSAGGYQWCNLGDEGNIKKYHSDVYKIGEIAQIKDDKIIEIYENPAAAAKKNGKCRTDIYRCINKERKSAYGFEWRRVEELKPILLCEYYDRNGVNQ